MIRKISNTILAFVLLITTTGLTINLHYCAGNLYSIAIDSDTDNCYGDGMYTGDMKSMDQNSQCHNEREESNHCDDETLLVKVSNDFTKTVQNIDISNSIVIILYNTFLPDKFKLFAPNEESTNLVDYNNSAPDTRQILSFIQSFLL